MKSAFAKKIRRQFFQVDLILLSITILFLTFLVLSSVTKNYDNFLYGKYDLGNMAQVSWNTLHGRFMELTDRFGSNMPRWGMSHFDFILVILSPLLLIYKSPLSLVYAEKIILISSVLPVFFISKRIIGGRFIPTIIAFSYLLNPLMGNLLLKTTFHGVSFSAGLFVWLFWLLVRNDYLVKDKRDFKNILLCGILLILILAGKEEIGAIMALFSAFMWFKNRKLAYAVFLISFLWFVISFFIIIPDGAKYRVESVNSFINKINAPPESASEVVSDNYFLNRYSYLGDGYLEIMLSAVKKPGLIKYMILREDNIKTLTLLFAPMLYISIFNPLNLILLPEYMINLLSSEPIFLYDSHRVSFVYIVNFLSYILVYAFLHRKLGSHKKLAIVVRILPFAALFSTIMFSAKNNPLFRHDIYTQSLRYSEESKSESVLLDKDCLGAKSSLREKNSIFPAGVEGADLIVANALEEKVYEPLNVTDWYQYNQSVLQKLEESSEYSKVLPCSGFSVFKRINQ